MQHAIVIPQIGTEEAATLIKWNVAVGDKVSVGDVVAVFETDKTTVEIEAEAAGVIAEVLASPGDELPVGHQIGTIGLEQDQDYRTNKKDILKSAKGIDASGDRCTSETSDSEIRIPLTATRKKIASNLLEVSHRTARASTTVEVDFENVARIRNLYKNRFREKHGMQLTFLAFVALCACEAIRKFSDVTATIDDEAGEWVTPKNINLGIAVARDTGLTVPVIENADRMDLISLALKIEEIATTVRSGSFISKGVKSRAITLTNPGSFGSYISQPIMNSGETSIICIDGIEPRVSVFDGQIAIRHKAFLTLAFDHRIVDGQLALAFLNEMKKNIESFLVDESLRNYAEAD